jgi:hypothetical protein
MRSRIEAEMVRYLWWLRPVIEGGPESEPVVNVPVRPQPRRQAPLTYSGPSDTPASSFPPPAAGGFPPPASQTPARVGGDDAPITQVKRDEPKIGRNDPCWCGSGKKYKKCHGAN